jgi:hypothetical protein
VFSHSGSTPLTHYPSSSLLLPIQIFRNSVNPTKETRGGKKFHKKKMGLCLIDLLDSQAACKGEEESAGVGATEHDPS